VLLFLKKLSTSRRLRPWLPGLHWRTFIPRLPLFFFQFDQFEHCVMLHFTNILLKEFDYATFHRQPSSTSWQNFLIIRIKFAATKTETYTLWAKKTPMLLFVHNFAKCMPIFKLLWPLNSAKNSNKALVMFLTTHFTYLATLPCEM